MEDNILDTGEPEIDNAILDTYLKRDHAELAKAKYLGDIQLKTVLRRQDELREDYLRERNENETRAKLEDVLRQIEQQKLTSSEPQKAKEENKPTIDLTQIDSIVANKVQAMKVADREQENVTAVKTRLQERFGENFPTAVKQQISALGLTEEDFNALAKKSPAALFRTLGLDDTSKERYQNPITGSSNFTPKVEPKRTWSWYQAMKKENPKMYHDPKITNQMAQDYEALGSEFEDGDFKRYN